jgi:hypothetical protein
MDNKKHIDRLFQEKLKNFEASPSDTVWQNIQTNLEKDVEGQKVIPLWIKITGIAAGLLLLLTLGNTFLGESDSSTPPQETVVDSNLEDGNLNNSVVEGTESTDPNNLNVNGQETVVDSNLKDDGQISQEDNTTLTVQDQLKTVEGQNNKVSESKVAEQSNTDATSNNLLKQQNKQPIQKKLEKAVVAENANQKEGLDQLKLDQIDKEKADAILTNDIETKKNAIAVSDISEEKKNDLQTDIQIEEDKTKNAIEDTAKLSLAEAIAQAEEESEEEEDELKRKRWSIMSNVAPIYYSSLGSGSSIDEQFVNNSKTGEINMSYGIAANYEISNKLSIRAGVSQLNLGYKTNDVVVYNNLDPGSGGSPALRNVALNEVGQTLSFLSANGLLFAQLPGVVADNISSTIDQEVGFIEVPVELAYKLSDNKLGVRLIGGFSTLFLNKNEIYTTLQDERRLLGEATNIKQTSFSANLGLGLDLEVSEKIDLNFEPVFKYQLNTFSNTSGNFNPYTIGVQTGLTFKF